MCFYYHLSKLAQQYKDRAQRAEVLKELDLVNGFAYPTMPVLTSESLLLMQWGLIPFWAMDDKIKKLTTAANPLMAKIHNTKKRMPVILTEEVENNWLEKDLPKSEIISFFTPIDDRLMEAYPIKPFKLQEPLQPGIINRL